MDFIGGIILLAVAVAMLVVGRGGRDGEPRAFLSNWLISTLYSVAILVIFVVGVGSFFLIGPPKLARAMRSRPRIASSFVSNFAADRRLRPCVYSNLNARLI